MPTGTPRRVGEETRNRRECLVLPFRATRFLCRNPENVDRTGINPRGRLLASDHHRKAFWARSRLCPRIECQTYRRAKRAPDLSDRSLSRQKDRTKSVGFLLSQSA